MVARIETILCNVNGFKVYRQLASYITRYRNIVYIHVAVTDTMSSTISKVKNTL